jgi:SAM-dependent methyltransferase
VGIGRVTEAGSQAHARSSERLLALLYDWEHDDFHDDVALYAALARRTGGPVLELACGTGRVLDVLSAPGVDVIGLDGSKAMLERARARLSGAPGRIDLIEGRLEDPLPPSPCALIVAPLDALGLVREPDPRLGLLRRLRERLLPDGLLALDLVHAAALADQPQGIPILQRVGPCPALGAHVTKWMVRHVRPAQQLIELNVFFDLLWTDGTVTRLTDEVALRFFGRYEIELLLRNAGFDVEGIYGDYDLGPFQDHSERLVILATPASGGGC